MSRREELNKYIGQVQSRLRLDATVRGAAIVAAVALVATVAITLILNAYAFPENGIAPARIVLFGLVVAAIAFGLAWPFLRMNRQRSIGRAETRFPELEQRLVTFSEREQTGDPFIELLAADTLEVAKDAPPVNLAPHPRVLLLAGISAACVGVLVWMIAAAPGFMGYGASLLWAGPKHDVAPLYEIKVTPGDQAVRRNSDQLVTAQVVGLDTHDVKLYARYQSTSRWEPVAMSANEGGSGFQFLFAGLPESVEYYVAAGPVKSKQYKFRVVDLPAVKQIQVTYHYPKWTGLQEVSEEHGGDLRALEGTDAELTVVMDSPLKDGVLVGDDGQPLKLIPLEGNKYRGTIHMAKDGAYHVAAIDSGQQVRLSEDYFISTEKANPPSIAIARPGADYRASPIEEVTIGVKAGADFGLTHVSMHYSVNGGPEKVVDLSKAPGAKTVDGTTMLSLEDYKLVPGDVVSMYATAKDAHAEAKTDISFIQVEPFEREYSQSQAGGGGGGGGGGGQQGSQTDISRREKELIAATWKQQNEKNPTEKEAADMGKVLSEAQQKLKEQVLALSARMESRELSAANEEFNSFGKDMQDAVKAMTPSAEKLKAQAWADAMPNEQKALQALLRAEATFRKIEVAFGQKGGGGGGGGGSAGRDLASLFDLELDTEKNQYETAQTGSPAEEQAKKVDDALSKLDALAKRQEEMAQQQNGKEPTFQQRWQQEMLRREAEQLQREMEQMQGQRDGKQAGQQSASNSSGSQGQSGQSGQSGSSQGKSGQSGQSGQTGQSGQQQASSKDGGADPRVQQSLDRLRAANEAMRRAGTQGQNGQRGAQQSAEEARRAAEQLRAAQSLLGGTQKDQASSKVDSLARQAGELTKEEADQAARIRTLAEKSQQAPDGGRTAQQIAEMMGERNRLADERQKLSDGLEKLQRGMRDTARSTAPTQPGVSSKLRDALGGMDESDLLNRTQRTADWLRSGINPESNGTEGQIAQGLKSLSDQMRQAGQAMGSGDAQGKGSQRRAGQGTETAALDHVDKLRNELQSLGLQRGQDGQNGRGQGNGQQGQDGKSGQRGQQGQGGQKGQAGGQQGSGQQAQGGQQNGQGGGARGGDQRSGNGGDLGGDVRRGGGGVGTPNWNVDTGGQRYAAAGKGIDNPDVGALHGDTQQTIDQGLKELNQLRTLAKNDPAALKEIDDLVKSMQKLDPSRFPGNPAMVEKLHTQVLNDVDKLELQLRRNTDDLQPGQVRTSKPQTIPPGYEDAVAEYYRRLGKGQ
jgi:hypothetical protein